MRKLLTTIAVLGLIVSPAFAQSMNTDVTVGSRWQAPAYHQGYRDRVSSRADFDAYAYEPGPYGSNKPSCAGDLGYGRLDYSSC